MASVCGVSQALAVLLAVPVLALMRVGARLARRRMKDDDVADLGTA